MKIAPKHVTNPGSIENVNDDDDDEDLSDDEIESKYRQKVNDFADS